MVTAPIEVIAVDGDLSMEDLLPNEGCMITVTHKGFIKRTSLDEYRSQKRGGKGVIGSGQYEDDFVSISSRHRRTITSCAS